MTDYQSILVAIDFSDAAHKVIDRAKDIAQRNHTDLTLIHVVEYLPPIDIAYEPVMTSSWIIDEGELIKQAKTTLEKFCQQHDISTAKQVVNSGSPKLEIGQYARQKQCDLVILGSHGRHGIGLLLGSTANGVLHDMPCDILAVRIDD